MSLRLLRIVVATYRLDDRGLLPDDEPLPPGAQARRARDVATACRSSTAATRRRSTPATAGSDHLLRPALLEPRSSRTRTTSLATCRYVELNPVRDRSSRRPAEDWPWSSHRATVGIEPPARRSITLARSGESSAANRGVPCTRRRASSRRRLLETRPVSDTGVKRSRTRLGERVLGAGAALGRGQPTALGGDRAALDTVRRRHLHRDLAVAVASARPRNLRRAHVHPQLRHLARHMRSSRMWFGWSSRVLLPESEDRRELVEGQLAVRHGIESPCRS